MIRLFTAIELPETLRQRMAILCAGVPGARWVTPENMHVTLRFIGEVDGGTFQDIAEALGDIEAPAFEIELEGIGFFGTGKTPRSIHVNIARNPAVTHLRDKIESRLVRMGLAREERKFIPHVTLARLKGTHSERIGAYITHNNLFRAGPVPVEHFTLFSSFTSHNGPIYRVEHIYPLKGTVRSLAESG